MDDTNRRFAPDYTTARGWFRAATATLPHGAIPVVDDLTIDWAWSGDPKAARILVVSSGLHGVEGFGGSAMQLELLARGGDLAVLWLHALNPWGMHHVRRVNENNVDLNRNFLAPDDTYTGANPHYAMMDGFLNPPSPPGADFFWIRAGWHMARHGFGALKNAVVGGQYTHPKGLFYGGDRLQPGAARLLEFLDGALADRERIVHLELHSGLGARGGRTLLLEGAAPPAQIARVHATFGPDVKTWDASNKDAYSIRGGLTRELDRRLRGPRYDALTCELGTLKNLAVLVALRDENRLHHHGTPTADHPVKQRLRETFAPTDAAWQAAALAHAPILYDQARALLAHD